MNKTNGTETPQDRAYELAYGCACGNRVMVKIECRRDNKVAALPTQHCTLCPSLPVMQFRGARQLDVSRIVRPVAAMPVAGAKA